MLKNELAQLKYLSEFGVKAIFEFNNLFCSHLILKLNENFKTYTLSL